MEGGEDVEVGDGGELGVAESRGGVQVAGLCELAQQVALHGLSTCSAYPQRATGIGA